MLISLNWLKDYIDLKPETDLNQITNVLTMAGLEVEHVEKLKELTKNIAIGIIKEKISDEDSTSVYSLFVNGKTLKAKTQRSDLKEDTVVGFIPASKTTKGAIGRLATLADLGMSTQQEVLVIQSKPQGEMPELLAEMPEFDDTIITLGITPNRADALSHIGVSRELAALMDLPMRAPALSFREMAGPTHERAVIEINNGNDCPRYALRVIENIKIEQSPLWLKMRLWSCGVRPINNVVDVTNYVMLSRGQPLHAYDYDKLAKENRRAKVIVRRAVPEEAFKALDGKEIKLSEDDVVISDLNSVIALAGVMGGAYSSVSDQTSTVLLESAYFDPAQVRMSARRHGISSESSYRFERGADPNGVVDALNYAARLLVEMSEAKSCREPLDAYRKRIDPLEIKMRLDRAQQILGLAASQFDEDNLRRKFLRLGIETVAKTGDAIYFRVPTFRPDCTREIDLIEEAARMIGYDKIKEYVAHEFKESDLFSDKKAEEVVKKMRERLLARGFSEAINYGFLNKEFQELFIKQSLKVIPVLNPLSERYNVMRLSLVPGLIKNLQHNQRNQEKSIQLFEIGTVFLGTREGVMGPQPQVLKGTLDQDSFSHERQYISGIMSGFGTYNAFDRPERPRDFYHLKGIVSECLSSVGLKDRGPNANILYRHGSSVPYLHPGESSQIVLAASPETLVGNLGKLHPQLAEKLDITGDVYIFELFVDTIINVGDHATRYVHFSRFPSIARDVALLADEETPIGDILAEAYLVPCASDILSDVNVFDIYRGKNIPAGKKSVAISLTLQKPDRTLTDEEAESFVGNFVELVSKKYGALVRQ